jgi:hypothetical protein
LCSSSLLQVTDTSGVFAKMTDSSQYTGGHKYRFNEDGTGTGRSGGLRVEVRKDLAAIVGR